MSFGIPVRNGLAIGLLSSTTLSSNGGLFPAMALDFLQPFLDTRVTFTRGSNATLVDSTGKITYAPANLLLHSELLTNAVWQKTGAGTGTPPVVSGTAVPGHASGVTGYAVTFNVGAGTTSGDTSRLFQDGIPGAGNLINRVAAVWMRVQTGTATIVFDIPGTPSSPVFAALTTTWQRFTVSGLASVGVSGVSFLARGDLTNQSFTVEISAPQIEQVTYQTTPGTYNATTSAAYYGPRFDYDPVTLAPRGLLIEEQRTNLLTYSQQIDNAAWAKTIVTVTANSTTAPDGTTSADTITTNNAIPDIAYAINFSTSSTGAFSIYAKANTSRYLVLVRGTYISGDYVIFDLQTGTITQSPTYAGSSAVIVNAANGWYRCTLISTQTTTVNAISISGASTGLTTASAGNMYVWGAQLEAGSFATSYIPTVASQVTRSADSVSMTGTNFSSWYNQSAGSFVTSADTFAPESVFPHIINASNGSGVESIQTRYVAGSAYTVVDNSVQQASISLPTPAANTPQTRAFAYAVNDFAASASGGTVQTATSGSLPTVNVLFIGARRDGLGEFLNGHIRSIAYYNTRLANAQLQQLTAPPLVTTLSLDFINGVYNA